MNNGRANAIVLATLAALGGLILGATAMLAAIEARDDGESDVEARVEELFGNIGGSEGASFELELTSLHPEFPRSLPLPLDAEYIGGFALGNEDQADPDAAIYAFFRSNQRPDEVVASLRERLPNGWTEPDDPIGRFVPENEASATFCGPDAGESHPVAEVRVTEADGVTITSIVVLQGGASLFRCDDQSTVVLRAEAQANADVELLGLRPILIAVFSGVRPAGASLSGLTSSGGSASTGSVQTTTESRTFAVDLPAGEVLSHYIEELSDEPGLVFSAPQATDRIAIVGLQGEDERVGPYEGAIVITSDGKGQVTASLSLAYENSPAQR